jgi:hypothetical protein
MNSTPSCAPGNSLKPPPAHSLPLHTDATPSRKLDARSHVPALVWLWAFHDIWARLFFPIEEIGCHVRIHAQETGTAHT